MKVFLASLLVVFCIMTFCSCEKDISNPANCCFFYVRKQIPQENVVSFYRTSSLCSLKAVIFVTTKNQEICANPDDAWVQDYINDLDYSKPTEAGELL